MSSYYQLTRKVDRQIDFINLTGSAIPEGTACSTDSANPPTLNRLGGIKPTTDDTSFVGVTTAAVPNGATCQLQVEGIAIGLAGADLTYGTHVALMSDSSGNIVPRTSKKAMAGILLRSAVSGDQCQFFISRGPNAV